MPLAIALATSKDLPALDADDHGFVAALRARGVNVTLPVWDAAADNAFVDVDACVIRSTWDYSERCGAFLDFCARVDARTALFNPLPIVRWNADKHYLKDLAAEGVPTVPTLWLEQQAGAVDGAVDVDAVLAAADFDVDGGLVVKPRVGAGSRDTVALAAGDRAGFAAFMARERPKQALMVQPFLPAIARGEVSLIFLGGRYSHAVKKTPKAGDFRSQPEFGSQIAAHAPSAAERTVADHALHIAGGLPLYARVDLVEHAGAPVVIELELIEPCLYLDFADGAADRFADAVVARAARR